MVSQKTELFYLETGLILRKEARSELIHKTLEVVVRLENKCTAFLGMSAPSLTNFIAY